MAPRMTKNLSFKIGAAEFQLEVSNVEIVPSPVTWQGGTENAVYADATWAANVTAVNDYQTAESFFNFCLEHKYERAVLTYMPDEDGDFEAVTNVTIMPPTIGGPVNAFNESTLSMPATEPVISPIAP